METNILILLVFLTFLAELIAFSSLNTARGSVFALLGFGAYLIGIIIALFSKKIILQGFNSFFSEWSMISYFGGMLLAAPVLRKRVGALLVSLDDIAQKTMRWILIFLMIPVSFLFYISTLPDQYRISGDHPGPVYDQTFYFDRIPTWILLVIMIGWILIVVLKKIEFRQKGIIYYNIFINWSDVVSSSWYELDGQTRISIKYKRILWPKPISIVLLVPSEKQQMVRDILQAKNIKEA